MKIINREMAGGKTTALLELMFRPDNRDVIYVAPTNKQAEVARRMYADMFGVTPPAGRFISARAIPRTNRGVYPTPRYVLDEFHGILGGLVGGEVIAVAGTDEDLRQGQMIRIREGR